MSSSEWFSFYSMFILAYFVLLDLGYILLFVLAWSAITRHLRFARAINIDEFVSSPLAPKVSILVPAYNEASGIADSLHSLLTLRYAQYEVIVVNDGSTDETLEVLVRQYDLQPSARVYKPDIPTETVLGIYSSKTEPRLLVVDKHNGGKADALNCATNLASGRLLCSMDADSTLDADALLRSCAPFMEEPDLVVAAGGIVRVANGCDISRGHLERLALSPSWLARMQVVEYLRAFMIGRSGWSKLNALIIISGTFGVFRTDIVRKIGGYDSTTIGEDAELVVRMHRYMRSLQRPYAIRFIPDPVCWTEAPERFATLLGQRMRWQRGLKQCLWKHRSMMLNPRFGVVGMFALPFTLLFELLGPIIEITGLVAISIGFATGNVELQFFLVLLSIAVMFGAGLSIATLAMQDASMRRYTRQRDLILLIVAGVFEGLGLRQLVAIWRTYAMLPRRRHKITWGTMAHIGVRSAPRADVNDSTRSSSKRKVAS